jgi:hypothetical protein
MPVPATPHRNRPRSGSSSAAPAEIEGVIRIVRSERVILDADLAKLYGVPTKVLNQAVKRNAKKFPSDFMFRLTRREAIDLQHARRQNDAILRSQIVTLRHGRHVKHLPFAFTEHGAIMAATVLNSPQAVHMSVWVVRAFVKMRGLLTDTRELARKLAALEEELTSRLDTHETAIVGVLHRFMQLIDPPPGPETPPKEIGFHTTLKPPPGGKT